MPRRIRPWRSNCRAPARLADVVGDDRQVSRLRCSASASMSVSGAPTGPNPPTMIVSPERMRTRLLGADRAHVGGVSPSEPVEQRGHHRRPRLAAAPRDALAFDFTDVPHVTRIVRAPHMRPSATSIVTSSPITAICPVGRPRRSLTASTAAWDGLPTTVGSRRDLGECGGHHRAAAEDRTVEPRVHGA